MPSLLSSATATFDSGLTTIVARGQVTVVDNQVDPTTGTVKIKAVFPNDDLALWPGQFVDVMMVLDVRRSAILVPTPAVQDGQTGPFIFVVKADKTAEVRPVTTGPSRNGETLVEKGIEAGETVGVDGQGRLTIGARVEAKPAKPAGPAS